jgi:hypothetical protein
MVWQAFPIPFEFAFPKDIQLLSARYYRNVEWELKAFPIYGDYKFDDSGIQSP